jgi:hypothetical protein
MKEEQIKIILLSAIKAQSLLHTLDEIAIENSYTKKTKTIINNYLGSVKNLVNHLEKQQVNFFENLVKDKEDITNTDMFIDCVTAFDELGNSIVNNQNETKNDENKS